MRKINLILIIVITFAIALFLGMHLGRLELIESFREQGIGNICRLLK